MKMRRTEDGTGYVLDKGASDIEELLGPIRELWERKGHDYTQGSEDRLKNFRDASERLGIPMRVVWAVYAGKHWDALMTYAKTGKVESEGLRSRFNDMATYSLLGLLIYLEETNEVDG